MLMTILRSDRIWHRTIMREQPKIGLSNKIPHMYCYGLNRLATLF
jgi:hypothetical protein